MRFKTRQKLTGLRKKSLAQLSQHFQFLDFSCDRSQNLTALNNWGIGAWHQMCHLPPELELLRLQDASLSRKISLVPQQNYQRQKSYRQFFRSCFKLK